MALDQENWGTIVDDAALIGCGFVIGYDVKFEGHFEHLNPACDNEGAVWTSDVRSFEPQAIVVGDGMVGFLLAHDQRQGLVSRSGRNTIPWSQTRILDLIHTLRAVSTAAPVYFLSVPWMQPPALPDGQPDPVASAASHNEINRLIQSATQSSATTHFVDISPYITPAGHFQADVGGGTCRMSDGVHLYYRVGIHYVQTDCGKAPQRGVLSMIRQDLVEK